MIMRVALRDTYRPSGCRGGVGYFTILLGQAMGRLMREFEVYTAEPDAFPGCNTISDITFSCSGMKRKLISIQKQLRPYRRLSGYTHMIFPHPFEPLVHAPNSKRILVMHDVIPLMFRERNLKGMLQYLYYKNYLLRILHRVDKIVAISNNTKNDLLKMYNLMPSKIEVIPCGYNSGLAAVSAADSKLAINNYILCIGSALPHKNIMQLIKAMALIGSKLDIDLGVAGMHETENHFKITTQHNIRNRVHFLGAVSDERLSAILKNAKALVFPSLYEGFGMPPLEAMSCGVPAVVSNASSMPEVCGEAAVYFDPLSASDMATAIERALADNGLREKCIRKGYEQVERYKWDAIANKYLELIINL